MVGTEVETEISASKFTQTKLTTRKLAGWFYLIKDLKYLNVCFRSTLTITFDKHWQFTKF